METMAFKGKSGVNVRKQSMHQVTKPTENHQFRGDMKYVNMRNEQNPAAAPVYPKASAASL